MIKIYTGFFNKKKMPNFKFLLVNLYILISDLVIKLNKDTRLKAHKFVLDARSKNWDSQNLSLISELDLSDISYEIGFRFVLSNIEAI